MYSHQATLFILEALLEKDQSTQIRTNLDDEQLVKLCKERNPSAQRTLYDNYANVMFHVCLRYLIDQMESEDAMIAGFTKVFSKIDTFEYRGKGSLAGWIKRIMINESLMILRKKKYEKVDISQLMGLESQVLTDAGMDHTAILKYIFELPKGYRTVFNMYVIEGYNHKEIGKRLSISENTSKSQLSKARASLIKSLKKGGII